MKVEHELLLFNTVIHLLQIQNETNEKQNENYSTKSRENKEPIVKNPPQSQKETVTPNATIRNQNKKSNDIDKKIVGLQNKIDIQKSTIECQKKRMDEIEKKNLELQNKMHTQNPKINNGNKYKLDNVERKNLELQNKIESQNIIIEKLNTTVKELTKKVEILENKGNEMRNKNEQNMKKSNEHFESLEKLIKNESSETNLKSIFLENQLEDLKKQIGALKKQIGALNQFAEDVSNLHLTLSNPLIRLNYPTVNQKEYEERKEFKQWTNFTKEISKRNDALAHVANLKKAVASYSRTVFPKNHSDRFKIASHMLSSDIINVNLLKLECPYNFRYVSIKLIHKYDEFQQILGTKRYFQNSHRVLSHPDVNNDIFNVFLYDGSKNVTLFHSTDEKRHLKIPSDGTIVNMQKHCDDGDDNGFYKFKFLIFYFQD